MEKREKERKRDQGIERESGREMEKEGRDRKKDRGKRG